MELVIPLIVGLIIVGFALWLVKMLPIDETIKKIIVGVIIFVVVLWILSAVLSFFGYGGFGTYFGSSGRHPNR